MNQRNVDALAAILDEGIFKPDLLSAPLGSCGGDDMMVKARSRDIAVYLAARGVLVPSALTWKDLDAYDLGACPFCGDQLGPAMDITAGVDALERIAKGEVLGGGGAA